MSDIQQAVREKYGAIADVGHDRPRRKAGCCGPTACGCGDPITSNLYSDAETGGLPADAVAASLGCGNPTALLALEPGQTVLDLGSGGGIDVLLSAKRVGPTGKAYGLDMTDEMLALARENQRKAGATNVEFLKGTIEAIPLPDQLGRRHHLELRHQPVERQGRGAARGVPRAEARRPLRRLRRRRPRRRAGRHPPQHGAVGRLHRRRARGEGVRGEAARRPASPTSRSSRGASTTSTTRARSSTEGGVDVDALAPQVEGKFASAFIRATQAGGEELLRSGLLLVTETACRSPAGSRARGSRSSIAT